MAYEGIMGVRALSVKLWKSVKKRWKASRIHKQLIRQI